MRACLHLMLKWDKQTILFFFYSLLFMCEIRRMFSDIPEAGRMTARLVIVWIWSLSGGQREREKKTPRDAKDQWGGG